VIFFFIFVKGIHSFDAAPYFELIFEPADLFFLFEIIKKNKMDEWSLPRVAVPGRELVRGSKEYVSAQAAMYKAVRFHKSWTLKPVDVNESVANGAIAYNAMPRWYGMWVYILLHTYEDEDVDGTKQLKRGTYIMSCESDTSSAPIYAIDVVGPKHLWRGTAGVGLLCPNVHVRGASVEGRPPVRVMLQWVQMIALSGKTRYALPHTTRMSGLEALMSSASWTGEAWEWTWRHACVPSRSADESEKTTYAEELKALVQDASSPTGGAMVWVALGCAMVVAQPVAAGECVRAIASQWDAWQAAVGVPPQSVLFSPDAGWHVTGLGTFLMNKLRQGDVEAAEEMYVDAEGRPVAARLPLMMWSLWNPVTLDLVGTWKPEGVDVSDRPHVKVEGGSLVCGVLYNIHEGFSTDAFHMMEFLSSSAQVHWVVTDVMREWLEVMAEEARATAGGGGAGELQRFAGMARWRVQCMVRVTDRHQDVFSTHPMDAGMSRSLLTWLMRRERMTARDAPMRVQDMCNLINSMTEIGWRDGEGMRGRGMEEEEARQLGLGGMHPDIEERVQRIMHFPWPEKKRKEEGDEVKWDIAILPRLCPNVPGVFRGVHMQERPMHTLTSFITAMTEHQHSGSVVAAWFKKPEAVVGETRLHGGGGVA
jgi:hypothetical protein